MPVDLFGQRMRAFYLKATGRARGGLSLTQSRDTRRQWPGSRLAQKHRQTLDTPLRDIKDPLVALRRTPQRSGSLGFVCLDNWLLRKQLQLG